MTHEKEIQRWATCPDGTKVWWKDNLRDWLLTVNASWNKKYNYIVDDEYAELRKAEADGKSIEYNAYYAPNSGGVWSKHLGNITLPVENYRIKSDSPIYLMMNMQNFVKLKQMVKLLKLY